MSPRSCLMLGVLSIFLLGCNATRDGADAPDELARYGLHPGYKLRDIVEAAVADANKLLSNNVPFRFVAGWTRKRSRDSIPVWLAIGDNLTRGDMVFVPDDGRCVLVSEDWIARFFDEYRITGANRIAALALFLLHEAGHIANGDRGSYVGSESTADRAAINMSPTAAKKRETAADEFASNRVRQSLAGKTDPAGFSAAIKIGSFLILHQFEVSTSAQLAGFGGRSPKTYQDAGYSHENYERRLLVMNNAIQPSEAASELLRRFDLHRNQQTPAKD